MYRRSCSAPLSRIAFNFNTTQAHLSNGNTLPELQTLVDELNAIVGALELPQKTGPSSKLDARVQDAMKEFSECVPAGQLSRSFPKSYGELRS